MNSAATDSMFNANGSMFYLLHKGVEWALYSVNRTAGTVSRLGTMSGPIGMDGAVWHPTNPSLIYGISMGISNRNLYEVALPAGTATLLHNFDTEIPAGGYPSSRVQMSPDARYFAVTASTFAGQDSFDYVVVWDRQTGASKVLNIPAKFGAGVYLHSMEMDNSGQYIRLGSITQVFGTVFWHWQDDVFSASVTLPAPDYFGGHKVQGVGINLNQGRYGDEWLTRSLATPHIWTSLFTYPRKSGKPNWFEDSHATRVLTNGTFFDSRYLLGGGTGAFVSVGGGVYKLAGYLQYNGTANFDPPDTVRYGLTNLQQVAGIPTAPGQWSYDVPTDSVYVWLPDSSDPQATRDRLHIADWRPMMDEIVQLLPGSNGTWTWRRLAHHRTHYLDFDTGPRGNVDPTGSFVLFQSNWDGSPRTDVFLLMVPPLQSGTASAPPPPPPADSTPPSVSITSPAAGATVSGTVNITVSASDNVAVTTLKYYLDGGLFAVSSPPTSSLPWDSKSTGDGPHSLAVTAVDGAGNSTQATVSFKVSNAVDVDPLYFSSANYSVSKPATTAITVLRSGPINGTVSVQYATSDGTAKAGVNYQTSSGTLTFQPGVTAQTFNVRLIKKSVKNVPLTVNLTLSNPGGGALLGTPTTAVLTIQP